MKEMKRKISILEHVLVPRHEVLSEEEAEELLRRYDVSREQLPKIKISDPVIEEIRREMGVNVKVGDIVRIVRKSRTAGRSVYYRVVVEDTKS